jgi:hypothetical protein
MAEIPTFIAFHLNRFTQKDSTASDMVAHRSRCRQGRPGSTTHDASATAKWFRDSKDLNRHERHTVKGGIALHLEFAFL